MNTFCMMATTFGVLLAAQAQKSDNATAKKSPKQRAFDALDQDHNGVLIRDEFLGGSVGKAAQAKLEEFKKLDADESGALDFEEYKKYQLPRRTPKELAEQFARLDKDGDGKLTRAELAANPAMANPNAARRNFIRMDADEDGLLTLEEFQRRGPGVKITFTQQFHIRDLNDDGQLDREEFLKPSIGRPFHEAAKAAFVRADVDRSGSLDLDEYLLTRTGEPSAETAFRVLDRQGKKGLTLEQMTRTMTPQHAESIRRSFDQFDADQDGTWDDKEYEAWRTAREEAKQQAQPRPWFARYWVWFLVPVLAIGAVVLYVGFRRRRHRVTTLPVAQPVQTSTPRDSVQNGVVQADGSESVVESSKPEPRKRRPGSPSTSPEVTQPPAPPRSDESSADSAVSDAVADARPCIEDFRVE